MRPFIVAGNWKMNGSPESALTLADEIALALPLPPESLRRSVIAAVFPPSIFLHEVHSRVQSHRILCGAQDCSEHVSGAYTGETSASMISGIGASMVLVGHSERRTLFGDTLLRVSLKCQRALDAGLQPVLCIGENAEERSSNATERVLHEQIVSAVDTCSTDQLNRLVIAYEPVWAIGSGHAAEVSYIEEVHAMIRSIICANNNEVADNVSILYGGSVTTANAKEIFSAKGVDGALVGGASLRADSFLQLYRTALDCCSTSSC